MSLQNVQAVIGRAVTEPEYRNLLFANPDKALEGYQLTPEEIKSLKGLKQEEVGGAMGELEERISRLSIFPGRGSRPTALNPQPEPP